MRVLSLNTYGGSLLLGASALGAEIVGSYEDSGFGSDIQAHNFPGIKILRHRYEWPKQDLSETVVIAHPPCSAFSVQNPQKHTKGVDSDAFACTKHVLDYAMRNNALAICVESVMGALGGAWHVHQEFADRFGYHLYRVVQNGCMFGAQWRERFWGVWIRKGAAHPNLALKLTPRWDTVGNVIRGYEDDRTAGNQERLLERQKKKLLEDAGCSEDDLKFFFEPQEPPHATVALGTLLYHRKFKTDTSNSLDRAEVFRKYIGGFSSGTLVFLDPNGLCPVLMGGSFWYTNGRCLSERSFKRLMGFPADYTFPESPRNYRSNMKMYLSKGVMPPVAEWILEQVTTQLGWFTQARRSDRDNPNPYSPYTIECEPNQIADFRIRKDDWQFRNESQPPLRHEDELRVEFKFKIAEDPMTTEVRNALLLAKDVIEKVATETDTDEQALNNRKIALEQIELVLNPPPPPVPQPKQKAERPFKMRRGRHDFLVRDDNTTCGVCGLDREHQDHQPKPERPERPQREEVFRATKNGGTRKIVPVADAQVITGPSVQKRQKIHALLVERGEMTYDDLVQLIMTDVNILESTARWHVRQMIEMGALQEAGL